MDSTVTVKDAAGMLGVSVATLRNWDRSGRLKARRHPVNGYRIYALESVLELQKSMLLWSVEPPPQPAGGLRSAPISRLELRRLVNALHRVLRDSDGNSSLVERFDELAKLIVLKVETERSSRVAEAADLAAPGPDRDVAARIRTAFDLLVSASPALFPPRFGEIRLSDRAVAESVRLLAPVTLGRNGEDIKGLLFEEVVNNTFEKGDNQQFFTPASIVEFMVDFVGDWIRGEIADPACGTGGFLIAAQRKLQRAASQLRSAARLWGLEVDARLAWAAGVNLHLHNADSYRILHVDGAGSLARSVVGAMPPLDLIITNPPFGSDLSDLEALDSFELGRGKKSRRRGVLFMERCLQLLKPGGVLAAIIDDGVLNAPGNADTRALLLSHADLFAVVSLPEVAFMPYASVKASVLFLQKHGGDVRRAMSMKGTFFAAAEEVGRKPSGDPLYQFNSVTRRLELESDLPEVLQAWRAGSSDSRLVFWARLPDAGDPKFASALHRLDPSFHHPSRIRATAMLHSSPHPLHQLSELCRLRSETVIPAEQLPDEEINYVGLANIEPQTGVISPTVVPGSTLKSSVKRFVGGDVLFSKMRPELRKVAMAPADIGDGLCSAECLVLVPIRDGKIEFIPEFLAYLLRSDLVYGQLVHQVMGIGRPRIRPADVLAAKVPIPPIADQRALLVALDNAEAASRALVQESARCREMASRMRVESVDLMASRLLGRSGGD
jgi:predicted RNA methylase